MGLHCWIPQGKIPYTALTPQQFSLFWFCRCEKNILIKTYTPFPHLLQHAVSPSPNPTRRWPLWARIWWPSPQPQIATPSWEQRNECQQQHCPYSLWPDLPACLTQRRCGLSWLPHLPHAGVGQPLCYPHHAAHYDVTAHATFVSKGSRKADRGWRCQTTQINSVICLWEGEGGLFINKMCFDFLLYDVQFGVLCIYDIIYVFQLIVMTWERGACYSCLLINESILLCYLL